MIVYNKEKVKNIQTTLYDELYVISDFDGTLTQGAYNSSWASIFKNPKVSDEFVQECVKTFNYYHKFEIDNDILTKEKNELMEKWYQQNIELLKQFNITRDMIIESAKYLSFRYGAKDFLKDMYENRIPVVIVSAGVGDIIEQVLINENSNYDNIYIYSNFFKYENSKIIGIRDNDFIHPLNKNEIIISNELKSIILNRKNILLLGNNLYDSGMANGENSIFRVGFLDENIEERIEEYKAFYDIVCTGNSSFFDLKEILNKN